MASGAVRSVVDRPLFANPGSAPPELSPTGSEIAYVRTWDGKLLSREDLFVGTTDVTAKLDRDLWSCTAGRCEWSPGMLIGDPLDGVSERLYRIDPSPSIPKALTSANGSVEAFSIARTGRIAFAWTTPTQPPEIDGLDPGGAPRRLTHFPSAPADQPIAQTPHRRMVRPQRVYAPRAANNPGGWKPHRAADRDRAAWWATMRR